MRIPLLYLLCFTAISISAAEHGFHLTCRTPGQPDAETECTEPNPETHRGV